jgi:cbb3-type cytochrome oxidase subunit 1
MIAQPELIRLKFLHSHLMLLGWVSMMIYGVGYHILPRFSGKPLKSRAVAEVQLWLANVGLVGMTLSYTAGHRIPAAVFGVMEAASILLFLYNMLATLLAKEPEQ